VTVQNNYNKEYDTWLYIWECDTCLTPAVLMEDQMEIPLQHMHSQQFRNRNR
jgi:hypothetical protein